MTTDLEALEVIEEATKKNARTTAHGAKEGHGHMPLRVSFRGRLKRAQAADQTRRAKQFMDARKGNAK